MDEVVHHGLRRAERLLTVPFLLNSPAEYNYRKRKQHQWEELVIPVSKTLRVYN
jgi:hypothetical protein